MADFGKAGPSTVTAGSAARLLARDSAHDPCFGREGDRAVRLPSKRTLEMFGQGLAITGFETCNVGRRGAGAAQERSPEVGEGGEPCGDLDRLTDNAAKTGAATQRLERIGSADRRTLTSGGRSAPSP